MPLPSTDSLPAAVTAAGPFDAAVAEDLLSYVPQGARYPDHAVDSLISFLNAPPLPGRLPDPRPPEKGTGERGGGLAGPTSIPGPEGRND